jgi:hypothetical protein
MRGWQPLVKFGTLAIGMALLLALMQGLFARFRLDHRGGRDPVLIQSVVVQVITAIAVLVTGLRTPKRAAATPVALLVVITLGAALTTWLVVCWPRM